MKHTLHNLIVLLLSVAGILLLNIGFMFLLLGFLPTVIAYFVDSTPKQDLYKTVRAANFAGMLPTAVTLTKSSYPAAALQIAMNNPHTWMVVYASAAAGWILIWLCRLFSYLSLMAAGESRILLLKAAQDELAKEWGEELRQYVISEQ